jgi:AcrR family transcriptional regulator
MTERIDGRRLRYQHRRGELLTAVGEYALDHGIASLSLRRVARAVGVSHATLQHHFGTKEQLVDELVDHMLERTLRPERDTAVQQSDEPLRAMWAQWTSPTGLRDIRLSIEIVGQSLFEEPGYARTMQRSIVDRVDSMAHYMCTQGCPPEEAPLMATLLIAQFRGLMTDLLVTGDRERVEGAFEVVIDNASRSLRSWDRERTHAAAADAGEIRMRAGERVQTRAQ